MNSRSCIKPVCPTPHHLRKLDLSLIDQFIYDFYTPRILFLPNKDNIRVSDVVKIRSTCLKESLSELLTRYYPFAGEVSDDLLHIKCNDKVVDFIEVRVNQTLEEFLRQPNDEMLRKLTPKIMESSSGNYITSAQACLVNIFSCGGIGLATSIAHKLADGHSYFTFMKAWATTARGLSEIIISPTFMASELFPNNPTAKHSFPSKFRTTKENNSSKRFMFDSMALASLKAQIVGSHASRGPTRTEAITALVWKAVAQAAATVRPLSPQSPHALFSFVNLRKRSSPLLSNESLGNLITTANGICFLKKQPDLSSLIGEIRKSVAQIDSYYIDSIKGEMGHKVYDVKLRMLNDLSNVVDAGDCLFATSMLNNAMNGLDFCWGKPIWFLLGTKHKKQKYTEKAACRLFNE